MMMMMMMMMMMTNHLRKKMMQLNCHESKHKNNFGDDVFFEGAISLYTDILELVLMSFWKEQFIY